MNCFVTVQSPNGKNQYVNVSCVVRITDPADQPLYQCCTLEFSNGNTLRVLGTQHKVAAAFNQAIRNMMAGVV